MGCSGPCSQAGARALLLAAVICGRPAHGGSLSPDDVDSCIDSNTCIPGVSLVQTKANRAEGSAFLDPSLEVLPEIESFSMPSLPVDRLVNDTQLTELRRQNPSRGVYQVMMLELMPPDVSPVRNKIILAVINAFALGLVGIDRCFMGQYLLGIIKFVTVGGLGIWMFLDMALIFVNCLASYESMDVFGFHATFQPWQVKYAWWISFLAACLYTWKFILEPIANNLRTKFGGGKVPELP